MSHKKKNLFIFLACLLILIPLCFFGYVFYDVTRDAASRIQRGAINRIIASESPVYYDDEKTPIGVFFKRTHRKFIQYNEIPKIFIKALIAAEDGNFLNHNGIDFKSILRAFIVNIKSGKVVQGGSTISQQTAKNIFKREKRSYRAKLKELVQAFLLEREYSKEEILEMYTNQFFVTGYGKGLGIAAQCFFNKDAKDLELIEAAFIAGSVKGPNKYNPFIKKTEAERIQARDYAKQRKDYVLKNMLKLNFITKDQYAESKNVEIPFKEGKITYRLNVILDYIREQLESNYFRTILEEQGVDNAVGAGIRIYTSINKGIQEAALSSLRTHLPLLDVCLNGYSEGQKPNTFHELFNKNTKKSGSNLPFLSRITHIDLKNCRMVVTWRKGGGIIKYEGIKPMAEAWLKWKQGSSTGLTKKHVRDFLRNFKKEDTIPIQLLPTTGRDKDKMLMLSKIPELEGGIVVMQDGMMKAMVGGFLDRFFNRAVDAKRQLGSIFKPIVYTAALQLKWNTLDPLQNIREMFQFETTYYMPRPDHTPKSSSVSMDWAGAKSENMATVWLLYHLTDHLNMSEFKQIMKITGLDRAEGESYIEYKKRIRDQYGVVVNENAMRKAAFEKSRKEIVSDIIFSGHSEIFHNLKRLHFNLDKRRFNPENNYERQILRFSYKRLHSLNNRMKDRLDSISNLLKKKKEDITPEINKKLSDCLRYFYRTGKDIGQERIIYAEEPEFVLIAPLHPITSEWAINQNKQFLNGKIWIDGLFDADTLDSLHKNIKSNHMTLFSFKRYDPEVLFWVQDFRTIVNLSYVVYLSKQIGISSNLEPVLSFPLGPNAISVSEAALAYQTIMTGHTYPVTPDTGLEMIPIIRKIVDRDGEILWEYEPKPVKILTSRVSGLVTGILRRVMDEGTGKKAKDAIQVFGIPIPSFGKTGTSNLYTNSSFVGFIPGVGKKSGQLDIHKGYVIASYVGYDDNKPMKSKHLAIYGASGALPLWIDTAKAVVNETDYDQRIQPADLAFDPVSDLLSGYGDFLTVPVSRLTGLPVTLQDGATPSQQFEILADALFSGNRLDLKRHFEPTLGEIE